MTKGMSTIATMVLLLAMVLGLAGGAYSFLMNQQDVVTDRISQPSLETVNITCRTDEVTWWIQNTEEESITDTTGDILITKNGVRQDSRDYEFANGGETWKIGFPVQFTPSANYGFELVYGEKSVNAQCTAGDPWFDVDWTYRRNIQVSTSTLDSNDNTRIQLPAQQLVSQGKLQSHCQDIRIVADGQVTMHRINPTPQHCANTTPVSIIVNASAVASETESLYVYYGNLASQTGPHTTSLPATAPQSPLGEEERINIP